MPGPHGMIPKGPHGKIPKAKPKDRPEDELNARPVKRAYGAARKARLRRVP
jgi:hypothetical protein